MFLRLIFKQLKYHVNNININTLKVINFSEPLILELTLLANIF